MAAAMATATPSSPNAALLIKVVSSMPEEKRKKFYPVLRQWAETGKPWNGRVFSKDEVEQAIAAFERAAAAADPRVQAAGSSEGGNSAVAPNGKVEKRKLAEGWWPRWVLDANRGIEVLAAASRGKAPQWIPAKGVGIGYRGQTKRYLFVRAGRNEMDCERSEVRLPGGGRTAQALLEDLISRGDDPARHPDWTDGSDVASSAEDPSKPKAFMLPGVSEAEDKSEAKEEAIATSNEANDLMGELEGDFDRMALLSRSKLLKTKSCDHPDPLSEPCSIASIRMPPLTSEDVIRLPRKVAEERLSSLQLETVCFAARRFRIPLPDGRAAGFVLGDGTGCGKGRIISAMIFHMWNSGHKRSVWVSATNDLYYDACRDLQDLGADIPCISLKRLPPSGPLDKKGSLAHEELVRGLGIEGDGVIFLTYSLLVQTGQRRRTYALSVRTQQQRDQLLGLLDDRLHITKRVPKFGDDVSSVELCVGDRLVGIQGSRQLSAMEVPFTLTVERLLKKKLPGANDKKEGEDSKPAKETNATGEEEEPDEANGTELNAWNSRLGQLVEWLGGENATGLICFDEVHKAKNLVPDKEDHASTKTGLYANLLQTSCPKAPVLYVSATAATEVKHLGYMSRLGVWGPGTAFEDFNDFSKTLEDGGVAAMEMLAINLKALGAMSCRALAYVGTEFATHQCGLTAEQQSTYDKACGFWAKVLREYKRFCFAPELQKAFAKKHFQSRNKKVLETENGQELLKRLFQFFWGAQQRFFKAMINAVKVPAAVAKAQEAIARGEQVVMSIWATGEARTAAQMSKKKEETPGRVIVKSTSDESLLAAEVADKSTLDQLTACLYANLRLRSTVNFPGGVRVALMSRLSEVNGKRVTKLDDLRDIQMPAKLIFRSPATRRVAIDGVLSGTGEVVRFELCDDSMGERVIVGRVVEGPPSFKRAELEGWHLKAVGGRPLGKVQVRKVGQRLRKGQVISFQDAVISDHLSGPQMILEHFISEFFHTSDEKGAPVEWAVDVKSKLLTELQELKLPANALDEMVDLLGGVKNVAEMSGRSHRMKRRKNGTLAYVARADELRCPVEQANMFEQVYFQKGMKKVAIVTEVASAGISLHADRRQVRKDYQPPRRTMISVELPWGADKAIQCFGRVHRANQLVPPRFEMLCTPLGGEVRFLSAIARRMKLLGAVTKGDRMTSMGGGADRHMAVYDVNNAYGRKALETFYRDTSVANTVCNEPELIGIYKALPFIGVPGGDSAPEATGRWPTWADFAQEVCAVWKNLNLVEKFADFLEEEKQMRLNRTAENPLLNMFFNRILMLDISLQNAMYDSFFAVYMELERIDRQNGVYDDGIEYLNRDGGRVIHEIEVEHSEELYTDPKSKAQTTYVKLRMDRGINWETAKKAYDALERLPGSAEGFYAFRRRPDAPPMYILVKERLYLTGQSRRSWAARQRGRRYVVWRADTGAPADSDWRTEYTGDDFVHDSRYERTGEDEQALREVEAGWTALFEATRSKRIFHEHILTGDVLSAWRLVVGPKTKDDPTRPRLQIVRANTKSGCAVVGMRVNEADLPNMRYIMTCQQTAAKEGSKVHEGAQGVRAIAFIAAERTLEKIRTSPAARLSCSSWIDMHRLLAAESLIPNSADGLRGAQVALDLLAKKKVVQWDLTAGTLELTAERLAEPPLEGEALEQLLFPEDFQTLHVDDDDDAGSENQDLESDVGPGSVDPEGEADVDRLALLDDEEADDDSAEKDEGETSKALAASIPTPAKAARGARKAAKTPASKSSRKAEQLSPAVTPPAKKQKQALEEDGSEDDDDLFNELFSEMQALKPSKKRTSAEEPVGQSKPKQLSKAAQHR